jgi:hypothetical protein
MAKRKTQNSVEVGRDVDSSIIQVGNYPSATINNNIDGEGLGQSLGESISERERQVRWEEEIREFQGEDSRQVMETVLVSFISGIGIGASWKFAYPWNVQTIPFFVIGATVLFNVIGVTHFGLRRSMFKIFLLSIAFSLLLRYTPFAQTWMDVNQFVGAIFLAIIGAIIGLFVGVIQIFWHPLED